jgi:hypothetical protein
MKNFSHNFSKGNELGVKNMKAIFGFFDCTGSARMTSLMIAWAAISSSVKDRRRRPEGGVNGSQSKIPSMELGLYP